MDALTPAEFNNHSAQRTSGGKTTDVDKTPSFSPHKSAVRTKHFSKSSSVNNQEEASGFQDGSELAPITHADFKPVKLTTNVWHGKHKFPMKKLIMRRAARKSNDWKPPDSSGISQGDVDVSSLVRQAIKRGRDVALEGAKKTAAHNPQETTTEDMNKLLKMAMPWNPYNKDPSYKVKTSWDTGTIVDASSLQAKEHSIRDDPKETYQSSPDEFVNMDTPVLQGTQATSVTGVPYVTKPRPPPKLTDVPLEEIYDTATSTKDINSASTETDPNINLRTTEPTTTEFTKSDSAKTEMNLNLYSAESTTAESVKSNTAELKTSPNLPTAESKTAASGNSDFTKPTISTPESTTAESAKSDSTKPEINLNLYTAEPTTVESVKSASAGPDSKLNLFPAESSNPAESQGIPHEDTAEETTKEQTTGNSREEPLPNEQPRVLRQERSSQHGTSTIPEVNTNVHPGMSGSSGLRWNVALDRRNTSDSGKDKHSKKKKKRKSHSGTKDPADSGSPIIVGGIIGGILIVMAIVACVMQLWKKCKRRSARKQGDPEAGSVTSSSGDHVGKKDRKEKVISDREAARKKKKTSKRSSQSAPGNSNAKPQEIQSTNDTTDGPTSRTLNKGTAGDIPLTPVCTATGTPSAEVRINMEDSDSTLPESISSTSLRSEPSICTPNETPQSTPLKSRSTESLSTPAKSSLSESDILTCCKEPNVPHSTVPVDNLTFEDETRSTLATATSANEVPISTPADSFSIPMQPVQQTNAVALETGATNSSNESCKTPVAPCSDVMITVEDDDESKSPLLISENESSSVEVIYARKESTTETKKETDEKNESCDDVQNANNDPETRCDNDEMNLKVLTEEGKPMPPPPPRPPFASTELRQGKSMIGGRKALDNRRFIKHLTSGQYSSGFHGDINKSFNKIMTGNKHLADKSKGKRTVIKQQTKETRTSIKENILLAKSIVMNEKMDSVRDKKSALRRRIIHKALSHPATLRPHTPLSEEIAFAKSVILPDPAYQETERDTKERRKVVKELVDELINPSFEDMIKIFGASFNPDEKTRDLNDRNWHKRNVIMTDAKMLKAKNQKSTFLLDIQFGRNVICGPSTLDHEQNPRMGCTCYYCKKHWKKTGGPPCFKIPRDFNIAKDVYMINGKIYIRNPQEIIAAFGSTNSSSQYRPGIDTAKALLNL
ncbi:hypothetical protein ACROYT_G020287 [Oculina patagonica]